MPIIKLTNGEFKRVSYGSAAQLNTYLSEPEKLKEIKDDAERAKKEEFLMTVESIDWSDVDKKRSVKVGNVKHNPEIQRVLNDKSLKGKAKFDAMRIALTGKSADGKEPKFDDIP
jgi:hypothetical protein